MFTKIALIVENKKIKYCACTEAYLRKHLTTLKCNNNSTLGGFFVVFSREGITYIGSIMTSCACSPRSNSHMALSAARCLASD